eukprot:CAMPEP_0172478616 /NCGR_PEP_ID=MMETSP1066-20121228/2665_1 /TAXON_ID=671091 /ORGANISM="Coscinodiscus wailesii, Strain CCMP2513" /LENGTH=50 /DNA_ID=CAMNT_0013238339 /DNA_START=342 /DNA_END=490 /DNA_ORIENTATION=+
MSKNDDERAPATTHKEFDAEVMSTCMSPSEYREMLALKPSVRLHDFDTTS